MNSLALAADFFKMQWWLRRNNYPRQSHVFTKTKNRDKSLDLYLPKGSSSPTPIILFLHGGGWLSGHHRVVQTGVIRQLARGYAVASMDYTFSYRAKWPTQQKEVEVAIEFLKKKASKFNLNPDKIFLWGISAGGHLCAVAGANALNKIAGVVLWYPPTDLLNLGLPAYRRIPFDWVTSLLMGQNIRKNSTLAQTASPLHYITEHTPPFYIMHGTWDALVEAHSSIILHQKLQENRVPSTLKIIPKYVHADFRFNKQEHIQEIELFLDQIVSKRNHTRTTIYVP